MLPSSRLSVTRQSGCHSICPVSVCHSVCSSMSFWQPVWVPVRLYFSLPGCPSIRLLPSIPLLVSFRPSVSLLVTLSNCQFVRPIVCPSVSVVFFFHSCVGSFVCLSVCSPVYQSVCVSLGLLVRSFICMFVLRLCVRPPVR